MLRNDTIFNVHHIFRRDKNAVLKHGHGWKGGSHGPTVPGEPRVTAFWNSEMKIQLLMIALLVGDNQSVNLLVISWFTQASPCSAAWFHLQQLIGCSLVAPIPLNHLVEKVHFCCHQIGTLGNLMWHVTYSSVSKGVYSDGINRAQDAFATNLDPPIYGE